MKKTITLLSLMAVMLLLTTVCSAKNIKDMSKDELKKAFDSVAQNIGALEYAFYTFTLEYERTPKDIQEMIDKGHFRVEMDNPYSDKPVHLGKMGEKPVPGGLYYDQESDSIAQFACHFIDPNNTELMRYFQRRIYMFTHKELHKAIFGDNATRNEKLVRVYLLQMGDALDSFEQRYGRFPDSVDEMSRLGDVNVKYLNPMTGKRVVQTDKFSPGDFLYRIYTKKVSRKIPLVYPDGKKGFNETTEDEQFYELVGWGETEPVYYYSDDPDKESFDWEGKSGKKKLESVKDVCDDSDLNS